MRKFDLHTAKTAIARIHRGRPPKERRQNAVDAYNEGLATEEDDRLRQLHPRKGFRTFGPLRQKKAFSHEGTYAQWALLASRVTGFPVGGARDRVKKQPRPSSEPSLREMRRRAQRMA